MSKKECEKCTKEMTKFSSQDGKDIFMCSCCGTIYLPPDVKNRKVKKYEFSSGYKYSIGTLIPEGNFPTELQAECLKELADKLDINVDIYSLSKRQARALIDKLKEDLDKKNSYLVFGQYVLIQEETSGPVWVRFELGSGEILDRKWLQDLKDKLHPNDDWTNVNLETYAHSIVNFNPKESFEIIEAAMRDKVVGFLD